MPVILNTALAHILTSFKYSRFGFLWKPIFRMMSKPHLDQIIL